MSMSTIVKGIKPPDEKWKKMKAIYDSCKNANIEPPDDVWKFFDNDVPDDKGVIVELKTHEWFDDGSSGYEININELPKDVTVIRFYNSW